MTLSTKRTIRFGFSPHKEARRGLERFGVGENRIPRWTRGYVSPPTPLVGTSNPAQPCTPPTPHRIRARITRWKRSFHLSDVPGIAHSTRTGSVTTMRRTRKRACGHERNGRKNAFGWNETTHTPGRPGRTPAIAGYGWAPQGGWFFCVWVRGCGNPGKAGFSVRGGRGYPTYAMPRPGTGRVPSGRAWSWVRVTTGPGGLGRGDPGPQVADPRRDTRPSCAHLPGPGSGLPGDMRHRTGWPTGENESPGAGRGSSGEERFTWPAPGVHRGSGRPAAPGLQDHEVGRVLAQDHPPADHRNPRRARSPGAYTLRTAASSHTRQPASLPSRPSPAGEPEAHVGAFARAAFHDRAGGLDPQANEYSTRFASTTRRGTL
jgi:hypothetical protein